MKRFKSRLAGALAIALLAAPITAAQAADTTDPAQAAATTAAMDRTPQTKEDKAAAAAQKKAQKQAQSAQRKATQREKAAERRRERAARFKTLFVDNGFTALPRVRIRSSTRTSIFWSTTIAAPNGARSCSSQSWR